MRGHREVTLPIRDAKGQVRILKCDPSIKKNMKKEKIVKIIPLLKQNFPLRICSRHNFPVVTMKIRSLGEYWRRY